MWLQLLEVSVCDRIDLTENRENKRYTCSSAALFVVKSVFLINNRHYHNVILYIIAKFIQNIYMEPYVHISG